MGLQFGCEAGEFTGGYLPVRYQFRAVQLGEGNREGGLSPVPSMGQGDSPGKPIWPSPEMRSNPGAYCPCNVDVPAGRGRRAGHPGAGPTRAGGWQIREMQSTS